mgnify:CR=1 FL=1
MKNKKKYIFIITILLLCSIIMYLLNENHDLKESSNNYENNKVTKRENMLSMMLETEANSGNYEMTTRDSWPTEGYVFNSELSKCENGGKLSWNDTNKRVVMNGNKSDKCYVYFDKYNPITINNYSITSNGNSITITIDATAGTGTIAKYLYSKDNGVSYVQSANNTYTFTGLDKGTYNIKAYVQDSNGKNSEIISKTIEITSITLADYVKSLYTGTQGANNIYYHTSTLTNGAGDNSYRYAGASENVNNFVCFGSTTSPCPTDNLYRIIGVFGDQVKLIKYDYANSNLLGTDGDYSPDTYSKSIYSYKGELTTINRYYWNYKANNTASNTWSTSFFNRINLNKNFINNIGTTWAAKIDTTPWKVGGNTWANIAKQPAKTAYQNEIVSPVTTNTTDGATEYSAKIGLMYASDYGFAAAQSAWTANLNTYNGEAIKNVNWMYMGLFEWTISRYADSSDLAFYVDSGGNDDSISNVVSSPICVRPSFNLSSSVTYVEGDGTKNLPIRIN